MGLFDFLKQKPMWEREKERRERHGRKMAKAGYELAETKRHESLLLRRAEIARSRMRAQELRPRPSPLASLRDVFRRVSISEATERRSRSLERQLPSARKGAEIAGARGYAQRFGPKPTQPAGAPDYGKIADALNFNPLRPPKKQR